MATAEERMKILKMIDEGKISAEEGAKLLATLAETRRSVPGPLPSRMPGGARWLRVRVTDTVTGKAKATVQLPLNLLDAGMKIGAHFAAEINGVDMNVIMDALRNGMTGKIIDVIDEKDGEHVEIYVE